MQRIFLSWQFIFGSSLPAPPPPQKKPRGNHPVTESALTYRKGEISRFLVGCERGIGVWWSYERDRGWCKHWCHSSCFCTKLRCLESLFAVRSGFRIATGSQWFQGLGTFLAGALYREFREFMWILTTFLGEAVRNPSWFGCFCGLY